jgi:DnaK suppressor protein
MPLDIGDFPVLGIIDCYEALTNNDHIEEQKSHMIAYNTNYRLSSRRSIMEEKDLHFFKELLKERLKELLNQADGTLSDLTTQKENFPDPNDRASDDENRTFKLRMRDREHKLIKKFEKALERIEDEIFGQCESCGEDISIPRLQARLMTTRCIDCKNKEETLEK